MKQVDIRVIGRREIDMNTLTEKAFLEVDSLLKAYSELYDYKEYLWRNNKVTIKYHSISGTNEKELCNTWAELDMIEYKILSIINDKSNYKGLSLSKVTKVIDRILNSKWLNLALVGSFFYVFVGACAKQDIFGGFCDWYLISNNMIQFNIKQLVGVR